VVSYGIYLFHLPIAGALNGPTLRLLGGESLLQDLTHFTLTTAITWGVAELSFRLFESQILRLKSRYETTPEHPASPPPAS
jgi:peptidoglycan/LPS O-acetylase OafA/YrhL